MGRAVSWIAAVLACFAMGLDPQPGSCRCKDKYEQHKTKYRSPPFQCSLYSLAFDFAVFAISGIPPSTRFSGTP
eukprot:1644106-Rhodomonas_salina.1